MMCGFQRSRIHVPSFGKTFCIIYIEFWFINFTIFVDWRLFQFGTRARYSWPFGALIGLHQKLAFAFLQPVYVVLQIRDKWKSCILCMRCQNCLYTKTSSHNMISKPIKVMAFWLISLLFWINIIGNPRFMPWPRRIKNVHHKTYFPQVNNSYKY